VNLFGTRASGGLVAAVLLTTALAGCGAGQQSQTATQEPAVNGAAGGAGSIALRDVRIRADQDGDSVKNGQSVDLMFVAANRSGTVADRLLSIRSKYGDVTITPDAPEVPAGGSLIVGKPEAGNTEALEAVSTSRKAEATVKLKEPISNGLTYDFVFVFKQAGDVPVSVPLSAGEKAPRRATAEPEGGGESHTEGESH
jgi:hypothetical protein